MFGIKVFVLLLVVGLARPERLYTPPSFDSKKPTTTGTTPRYPSGSKNVAKTNAPAATPAGPVNPFNLTFVVSAKDLPVKKKGATVDSYIKVSYKTGALTPTTPASAKKPKSEWTAVGQTETLKSNNNPTFLAVFKYEWTKGKNEQWHFEVIEPHSLSKDVVLGQADINIDEYVLQKSQAMTVKLSDGGSLTVKKVEPVSFRLYARMVPKMDPLGGASDPFVECYWRIGRDGNDTKFYTTKVVKDSENPDWNENIEYLNYQKGANMWWNFKVFDEDSVSGNDVIGDALVEIDPFVVKRGAKVIQLSKDPKNKAALTITPA